MTTYRSLTAALALLLLAGAVLPTHAQDAKAGRRVFEGKGNCHLCHGKDGRGTPLGPSLADTVWTHVDGSQEAIVRLIRTGVPKPATFPGAMPPMGGASLSAAEIENVAAYVRSLARPPGSGSASLDPPRRSGQISNGSRASGNPGV